METIDALELDAGSWQFLSKPESYVAASKGNDRPLVLESTRRQFLTAQDILVRLSSSQEQADRRGVLLADDVDLGKTTVAAMVAWVVASAGEKRNVRILAPNDVMMRRWVEELESHVPLLQQCASHLDARINRVKKGKIGRLAAGAIQIVKHSYASQDSNLKCDLLIVDEAHRAKGDRTDFSVALKKQKRHAKRVLILTATPFSIHLEELRRMLHLVGGDEARAAVAAFDRALKDLYKGNPNRDADAVGAKLAAKAGAAIDMLRRFVIRHGIDDLPLEQREFGRLGPWDIEIPTANEQEVELMLRMDRMLRLLRPHDKDRRSQTNDPRFHVGWRHLDQEVKATEAIAGNLLVPEQPVVLAHLDAIRRLRSRIGGHSKMMAVAKSVRETVHAGEKVLLFCHHHATAQELTTVLAAELPKLYSRHEIRRSIWQNAWEEIISLPDGHSKQQGLRDTFIAWLCSEMICAQVQSWLPSLPTSSAALARLLRKTPSRKQPKAPTVTEAAVHLFHALIESDSARAVLKTAGDRDQVAMIPGGGGTTRVLGVCRPTEGESEHELFLHNQQPDTVIAVFNSPFGPDALVVTDKLSEGIDLHRYCRHLVHYELDPSPIRTVQRNGRLRRVNSWAAVTGQPIRYAYPAFAGTRDHRLVEIMKKRIGSFSLLLGGVVDIELDEVFDRDELWRLEVIAKAKSQLVEYAGKLRAVEPRIS